MNGLRLRRLSAGRNILIKIRLAHAEYVCMPLFRRRRSHRGRRRCTRYDKLAIALAVRRRSSHSLRH